MKLTQNQIDTLRQIANLAEEERICEEELGNIPRSEGEVMEKDRQDRPHGPKCKHCKVLKEDAP